MTLQYTQAIELRARWLRWAGEQVDEKYKAQRLGLPQGENYDIIEAYADVLKSSDTYYMNPKFSRLVDHARIEIPGNLQFDARWMQSPRGFMWLEEPFRVPPLVVDTEKREWVINAVGWRLLPAGSTLLYRSSGQKVVVGKGVYQFLFFQDFEAIGMPGTFGCWSYLHLLDGAKLEERIDEFERYASTAANDYAGSYAEQPLVKPEDCTHRIVHPLHEVRWLFAALHLMAQKYAVTVEHKPDRAVRRRAQREGRPEPPWIRVITLRRLEEARKKEAHKVVNWNWQWEVRGHWRNQWYAAEGIHKPVFVEAYIKGPDDKPLKEGAIKLFAAVR